MLIVNTSIRKLNVRFFKIRYLRGKKDWESNKASLNNGFQPIVKSCCLGSSWVFSFTDSLVNLAKMKLKKLPHYNYQTLLRMVINTYQRLQAITPKLLKIKLNKKNIWMFKNVSIYDWPSSELAAGGLLRSKKTNTHVTLEVLRNIFCYRCRST